MQLYYLGTTRYGPHKGDSTTQESPKHFPRINY
jgi:hypothetical protein